VHQRYSSSLASGVRAASFPQVSLSSGLPAALESQALGRGTRAVRAAVAAATSLQQTPNHVL